MKKQHEIDKALEMMKKRQEWFAQQPTRAEMRKQKSFITKAVNALDKGAEAIENFDSSKLLMKSKLLGRTHRFLFPEAWEEVEVPVEEEPEVGSYTKEDNIIHVHFGKKED